MKTIYAGLPFYDDIDKQDYRRVNSNIPFYCPTTALLSFEVCDVIANVPTSFDVYLVPCKDTTGGTLINSYFTATSDIISLTDYFYIVHDGADLATSLPYGRYYLRIDTNTTHSYYSEVFVVINTSKGKWCKIECSNSRDLGDIMYATGGFEEVYYLNTQINYPANEIIEIGEEKDGEFITEKLVTKYLYRLSDYVSRALHRCLIRLPQHDSITITDDVNNALTPAVGNVQITTDWPAFDVAHIVIQFNNGDNTAFAWTYGSANMT
jgi:hypothetical protein